MTGKRVPASIPKSYSRSVRGLVSSRATVQVQWSLWSHSAEIRSRHVPCVLERCLAGKWRNPPDMHQIADSISRQQNISLVCAIIDLHSGLDDEQLCAPEVWNERATAENARRAPHVGFSFSVIDATEHWSVAPQLNLSRQWTRWSLTVCLLNLLNNFLHRCKLANESPG